MAPYVAHAGYSMQDPGPWNDTEIRGIVRSLETGQPIPGIMVNVTGENIFRPSAYQVITDDKGYFILYVPDRESYEIHFRDTDGEQNGGFFKYKKSTVTFSDIGDILNIRLEGENDVTIQGVVRSERDGRPIPGIRLLINITETDIQYRVLTDNNGSFSVRVPERERYSIIIEDIDNSLFRGNIEEFLLSDIDNLNIVLEEENIITLRGIVRSEITGEPFDQIEVLFYSDTGLDGRQPFVRRHTAKTNWEGYFEIRIPERENYRILFNDPERNLSIGDNLNIILPYDNTILNINVRSR